MKKIAKNNYTESIRLIKSAILKSRYRAAALANRELLSLYYGIGKYISANSRKGFWGTRAIETISERLQQEMPGLRGFSPVNIKRMRQFYEEWCEYVENRALPTHNLELPINQEVIIRPLPTDELQINHLPEIRPSPTDEIQPADLHNFLSIGFTHHYELLIRTNSLEERLFYIEHCATEFWSVEKLQYHLKSNLFSKRGKFQTGISWKNEFLSVGA